MTRYPLAPLVILLAAVLSACAAGARGGTGTAVGQQEGQQQNNVISSTATVSGAKFGLNIGTEANVAPTLDSNATQAALVSQIATANANTATLQEKLNAQNVALRQLDLDIETAKERTASLVASGKASDAEVAKAKAEEQRLILLQIQAQKDLADAQNEAAQIEVERIGAMQSYNNVLAMCIVALVLVSMVLVLNRVLVKPYVVQEIRHTQDIVRPVVPKMDGGYTFLTLPVSPDVMDKFMHYALTGAPLGTNSMEAARVFMSTERYLHDAIMQYLDEECHHIDHDGKDTLNPVGRVYWTDWRSRYSPAELVNPKEAPPTRHDDGNHAMLQAGQGGDVPGDAFIAPEIAQFTPQGETTYTGLTPEKDGTK